MERIIEAFTGVTTEGKKSRMPAKLDKLLTATGVILAIFMMAHMFLYLQSYLVKKLCTLLQKCLNWILSSKVEYLLL